MGWPVTGRPVAWRMKKNKIFECKAVIGDDLHWLSFLFHRKEFVTLRHKSEIEEGPFYETKSTSCLGLHCGGKKDVAATFSIGRSYT